MIIIKNTLKISGFLSVLVMQGCVPEAAYYAHEVGGDSFSLNDKYLRVDPLEYPVFAMKEDRYAPVNPNSRAMNSGWYRHPELLKKYRWEITHAFNGRYLAYSKGYDYQYCSAHKLLNKKSPKRCADNYPGASNNIYVYIKDSGESYGYQFLRNPKRWLFPSDKVSFFDIKDYGDWSGQPWFECVERCDKLVNMK
ncbi:MAG TPA: hypothetical protein GX719_05620 [Gammaproteobacteria bacterium]|nr:hypothetical protein [Gammaproteobacteria bacterium]